MQSILARGPFLAGALLAAFALVGAPLAGEAASDAEAAARGQRVYNSLCWTCHGQYGRGDGPVAANVGRSLPDFTDSRRWDRSNAQILERLTSGGHGPMDIASVLKPEALADALAYIRTMYVPGKHVSPLAGRDVYNGACWVCHGVNGDGKGPAATHMEPPPRDFTSPKFQIKGREDEVYRAIELGPAKAFHGSPYMPDWGSRLTAQQIRDVIEHLKTFEQPAS